MSESKHTKEKTTTIIGTTTEKQDEKVSDNNYDIYIEYAIR